MKSFKFVMAAILAGGLLALAQTRQVYNVGVTANDGTGDTLRQAFIKAGNNESNLFATLFTNSTLEVTRDWLFDFNLTNDWQVRNLIDGTISARENLYINAEHLLQLGGDGTLYLSSNTNLAIMTPDMNSGTWTPADVVITNRVLTLVDPTNGFWEAVSLNQLVGNASISADKLTKWGSGKQLESTDVDIGDVETKVDSVADLVALDPTDKTLVQTLGYTAAGDGRGATYRWSASLPDNVQTNKTKWIAGTSGYWGLLEQASSGNLLDLAKGFSFPNVDFEVNNVAGTYTVNQSARDYEPAASVTYYLNSGGADGAWGAGNNANDGLSKANPKKSISTLVSALASSPPAGHVKFVLKENQYYSSTEGFNTVTVNFGLSVVTENGGVAYLPSGRCGAEFTLSAGAVYGRTGHSPTNIFTWTQLDQYGGPTKMTRDNTAYGSLAAVQAGLQPGTWTIYASNCYLRMHDDSVPDARTMTVSTASPTAGTIYCQDKDLYLEGLRITGNGSAVRWRSRLAVDKTFAAYNVQAAGGNDTTSTYDLWQLDADTGRAFLENCRADYGTKDGFNYHQNLWYTDPLRGFWVVEYNCAATRNGSTASDNGSTCHEAVHAVRVNGYYVGNSSRNVHDVHEAQTVNINCVAGQAVRTAATDDIAFESGQSGLSAYATKMWLINCASAGVGVNGYDFYAAELSTMTLIGSTGTRPADRTYVEAGAELLTDVDHVDPEPVTVFESVADLVASKRVATEQAVTLGYYTPGDGGGATYRWAAGYSGTTNAYGGALAVSGGAWVQLEDSTTDVRQFGASTSTVDNGPHIQAALDFVEDGGLVLLPFGTFDVQTGIVVSNKTVRIDGNGRLLATTEVTPLTIHGGLDTIYDVVGITDASVVLPYATDATEVTRIETDGNTPWNTGDIVKIVSDDVYEGAQTFTNFWRGEFAIVGARTNAYVWLTAKLRDTYTTAPRITKWKDNRVEVSGITISSSDDEGAGWRNNLVRVYQTRGSAFYNVRFIDNNDRMVENRGGYGTIFDGCVFQNARNDSTADQYGYGVDDIASGFTRVVNCVGINLRHTYATTIRQVSAGSDDVWDMGPVEHSTISHSVSQGTSNSGFDTHGNAYDVTFANCTVVGAYKGSGSGGPGFIARGRRVSLIDCRTYNCVTGVFIYEDNREGETADILIDGLQSFGNSEYGLRVGAVSPSVGIYNIDVRNSHFDGALAPCLVEDGINVNLTGNTFALIAMSGVTPESQIATIATRTSGVADPVATLNGNTFVLTNAPAAVTRAFLVDNAATVTGSGNRLYIGSSSIGNIFANITGSDNSVELSETWLDSAPAAVESANWASFRASFRGAVDTRHVAQTVTGDAPTLGTSLYTGYGGVSQYAERRTVIDATGNSTTLYAPITVAALGGGMFEGQEVLVRWRSINQNAESLLIPASGYGVTTKDGRDVLLSSGESALLVWDGSTWQAESVMSDGDAWHSNIAGARAVWGPSNNTYSQLSTFSGFSTGQPWSVLWVGDMPQRPPSSAATLFAFGSTSAASAAANTLAVWLNSSRNLIVRHRDSSNTAQDATYTEFTAKNGNQPIDLIVARPRGATALSVYANGRRVRTSSDHTISSADGLLDTPYFVIGRGAANTGTIGTAMRAAAVYPFAPGPVLADRIRASGPDWVLTYGTTVDSGAETITFPEATIATGSAVVAGTQVPTGLSAGTTYYVRNVSGNTYTMHASASDANSNLNIIDLTSTTSPTEWFIRPIGLWILSETVGGRVIGSGPSELHMTVAGTVEALRAIGPGLPILTIAESGGITTITGGKRASYSHFFNAATDGDTTLAWSGSVDGDSGTIYIHPAATNVTLTLPSYAFSPSGGTITVSGGTGSTNHTILAWETKSISSTNRISVNASNYYR